MTRAAIVTRLRAAGCVYAEDEARVLAEAASTPNELAAMIDRRAAGLPLEHVLGWAEFCGLRIAVDPGVFVPRPRTELLVREAATLMPPRAVVVDLCCGSGALGAALAAEAGPIDLHAADVDPVAVRCARRNLEPVGGRVHRGDLFDPLPPALLGRVDVLLANVPYVPTGALELMPRDVRNHEPRLALDGGPDGLNVARRVTRVAPDWLAAGGHLLIETSTEQAPRAADAMRGSGLIARVAGSDELDATVLIGRRPHSS